MEASKSCVADRPSEYGLALSALHSLSLQGIDAQAQRLGYTKHGFFRGDGRVKGAGIDGVAR